MDQVTLYLYLSSIFLTLDVCINPLCDTALETENIQTSRQQTIIFVSTLKSLIQNRQNSNRILMCDVFIFFFPRSYPLFLPSISPFPPLYPLSSFSSLLSLLPPFYPLFLFFDFSFFLPRIAKLTKVPPRRRPKASPKQWKTAFSSHLLGFFPPFFPFFPFFFFDLSCFLDLKARQNDCIKVAALILAWSSRFAFSAFSRAILLSSMISLYSFSIVRNRSSSSFSCFFSSV